MILELENNCLHYSDSEVLSTSWMRGFENEDDGWLACGNKSGTPSIIRTSVKHRKQSQNDVHNSDIHQTLSSSSSSSSSCSSAPEFGHKGRNNINLRTVHVPVHIVQWNPVHQKLATCTNSGSILVYKRTRGQWTVDLMNERAHAVEVFKWSRSSYQVMIGYADGLLIVGSVTGHRLWHRTMDMHSALVTAAQNSTNSVGNNNTNNEFYHINQTNQNHQNNQHHNHQPHPFNHPYTLPVTAGARLPDAAGGRIGGGGGGGAMLDGEGNVGNRINFAATAAAAATQQFDPYYNFANQRPPETLNFNLSENPFRNNLEDIVIVSRNYRRTTDISTYYHNDSMIRYRNMNNQLGYEFDMNQQTQPTDPTRIIPEISQQHIQLQRQIQQDMEEERSILRMLNLAGLTSDNVISETNNSIEPPPRLEDMPTITCGTWSPNDVILTVATSIGSILSFPFAWERLPLRLVRQRDRMLRLNDSILQIEWSCPEFRCVNDMDPELVAHQMQSMLSQRTANQNNSEASSLSESNSTPESSPTDTHQLYDDSENFLLAVAFNSGYLYLLQSLEDQNPIKIRTGLSRLCISWNSSGNLLAVGGFIRSANLECQCSLRLYSLKADIIYSVPVFSMNKPITSLCWAHQDSRIFVSAGVYVHTFRVRSTFPTLSEQCCDIIRGCLNHRTETIERLSPLPGFLKDKVRYHLSKTIQSHLPLPQRLREFVLLPRKETTYCVFQRSQSSNGSTRIIMYLEFMGASFPLLLAIKSGSVKQDYSIFDPSLSQVQEEDPLFPFEEVEQDHKACSNYCIWQRRLRNYQRALKTRHQGRNSIKITANNEVLLGVKESNQLLLLCLNNGKLPISNQINSKNNGKHLCICCKRELKYCRYVNSDNCSIENQNTTSCCNKCLASASIQFSNLMLDSNLPENLLLAKLKSNITSSRYELYGCQISLPHLLTRINFEEKLKNSPNSGVSIQLVEIKNTTGWKIVNFRKEFCSENRGVATVTSESDTRLSGLILPPNKDIPMKSCFDSNNDIIESCVSTPSHWTKGKSKQNFPLNIIRSLPSTPRKPANPVVNHIGLCKKSSSIIKNKCPVAVSPPPPTLRSFLINKHQSIVTWREENIPLLKKTTFYMDNEEVLSTGKLDSDRYFVEFRYPFSALQAFGFGISSINRLPK